MPSSCQILTIDFKDVGSRYRELPTHKAFLKCSHPYIPAKLPAVEMHLQMQDKAGRNQVFHASLKEGLRISNTPFFHWFNELAGDA
jgi:hypothetical protein